MTKISVILATYNGVKTLPRAIDSILEQTIKDIELIVVDDGSTDATPSLLSDYASKDNRLKVITQTNQGPAIARNNSAANASGKYLAFMDSDDACAVNRLEFQLDFLSRHPQFSACALHHLALIENYYSGIVVDVDDEHISIDLGSAFITRPPPTSLGAHSFMTRESFIKIGGYRPELTIIEDLDLTLRYSRHYSWAVIDNGTSYFYDAPLKNPDRKFTKKYLLDYIKRHIACYVSEWCCLNNIPDPVVQGKSLEEILSMTRTMPINDRVIIYWGMRYFTGAVSSVYGIGKNKSRKYLVSLLSDSIFVRKLIDFKCNRIRNKIT